MNTVTLTKNAQEFMSAFDGCVDKFYTAGTKFDPLKLVRQFKLSNREIIAVQSSLNVQDLELLAIGADEQLVEGYSNITKAQQRELLTMYHSVLEIPTAPTRERKEKTEGVKSAVVKEPKLPKIAKPVISTTPEHYDAVFAIASKYNCLRTFIGNVVITGAKITADRIQEYRYSKELNGTDFDSYTKDNFVGMLEASKPIDGGSVTLLGKCVDSVYKFN